MSKSFKYGIIGAGSMGREHIRNVNIKNFLDNAIEAAEQSDRIDIPKIEETNNETPEIPENNN